MVIDEDNNQVHTFHLTVHHVSVDDSGTFGCNAKNSLGMGTTTAQLHVFNVLPPAAEGSSQAALMPAHPPPVRLVPDNPLQVLMVPDNSLSVSMVPDGISKLLIFLCGGIGHKSASCPSPMLVCFYCSGDHLKNKQINEPL